MNNIYSSVAEFWIQTYLKQGAAGGRVRNVMNIAVILCQNGHIAQHSPTQPSTAQTAAQTAAQQRRMDRARITHW